MNSSETRVETYLDDLARMLADLEPGERDDVLAGIREHLDATLAEHADDPAAVNAALLRLGPPEQVAAEARGGSAPAARPSHHPGWGIAAVALTMIAVLPVLVVPTAQRLVHLTRGAEAMAAWPVGLEILALLMPVWLASVVAVLLADRLPNATRSRLATLGPVAAVASASTSLWWEPEVLSSVVTVGLLVTIAVVAVRAGLTGWREARSAR